MTNTKEKTKSVMNQVEWIAYHELGGLPSVYINVWNCNASVVAGDVDITDILPNGEAMAIQSVEKFGGYINMSGHYPPTNRIINWMGKEKYANRIEKLILLERERKIEIEKKKKKDGWKTLSNSIYNMVERATFKEVAEMMIEQFIRHEAKSYVPTSPFHSTFEEFIAELRKDESVDLMKPFPDNLKSICREVKEICGTITKKFDETLWKEWNAFFSKYPEMGYGIQEDGYMTKITSSIFNQYRLWSLYLENIEDEKSYIIY